MNDHEFIYEELSRLKASMNAPAYIANQSPLFKSKFQDSAWEWCSKNGRRLELNFDIKLDDASSLLDAKNLEILNFFKHWLLVTAAPSKQTNDQYSAETLFLRLGKCCHLIDYFLVRSRQFRISEFGLRYVTEKDIYDLISSVVGLNNVAESIYQWSWKLRTYLAGNIWAADIRSARDECPEIMDISPFKTDWFPECSEEFLIRARAFLWQSGVYKKGGYDQNKLGYKFKYFPNSRTIAKHIYKDTIFGVSAKPIPEELCFGIRDAFGTEYQAAPVKRRSTDGSMSDRCANLYARTLGLVGDIPLRHRQIAFAPPLKKRLARVVSDNSTETGRFRSLNPALAFRIIRHSIEYFLQWGDVLVSAYLEVLEISIAKNITLQDAFERGGGNGKAIEELRALKFNKWSIETANAGYSGAADCVPWRSAKYFAACRESTGLWEALCVLFGAMQVAIGVLTARRSSELTALRPDTCMDEEGRYLLFRNAKSGSGDKRDLIARPVPDIVARMIQLTRRLQDGMLALGCLESYAPIFSRPNFSKKQLLKSNPRTIDSSFDRFCDFFETALNDEGQRHYVRFHQLRRFFAMAFFWSGSDANIDVLRWFLGHTDVQHVYRYITDEIGGQALTEVKAEYAADLVVTKASKAQALSDYLLQRFGMAKYAVMTSSELVDACDDLISEGKLIVEPHFYTDQDGQSYLILVKLTARALE